MVLLFLIRRQHLYKGVLRRRLQLVEFIGLHKSECRRRVKIRQETYICILISVLKILKVSFVHTVLGFPETSARKPDSAGADQ